MALTVVFPISIHGDFLDLPFSAASVGAGERIQTPRESLLSPSVNVFDAKITEWLFPRLEISLWAFQSQIFFFFSQACVSCSG